MLQVGAWAAAAAHAAPSGPDESYICFDDIASRYQLPISSGEPAGTVTLGTLNKRVEAVIGSREILVDGIRTWLSFPVQSQSDRVCISTLDFLTALQPQLQPEKAAGVSPFTTVVLDPGHGGHDLGAMSRFGCEKDYTLDLARRVKPYLEALKLRVIMTRERDQFVSLERRAELANAATDSIFVSIHLNAATTNTAAAGFEVFSLTPSGAPSTDEDTAPVGASSHEGGGKTTIPSLVLAACVQHSLVGHVPNADRGLKRARFAVLRLAHRPAVLIEGGFLTSAVQSKAIADTSWRARLAHAIAMGIYNYKNLADRKKRPLRVADFRLLTPKTEDAPRSLEPTYHDVPQHSVGRSCHW